MANSISGNAGIAGALVILSGKAFSTTVADGSGNYTFSGLAAGNYFISCQKYGQQFLPWSSLQTIVSSDITQVNFVAASPVLTQVWEKQGTVISNGSSLGTMNPSVIFEGNPQILSGNVFKMWYTSEAGAALGIYYAESLDGITWSQYSGNPVISNQQTMPNVFENGGTYYIYSEDNFGIGSGFNQYTSSDGINWTLANSNVLSPGSAGAWDSGQIFGMSVVDIVGGTWRALYGGNHTNGADHLGLATSPDGVVWTKYASNPVLYNFSSQNVVKIGATYYAWGDVCLFGQGGSSPLLFPTDFYRSSSTDLINWTTPIPSLSRTTASEGAGLKNAQIDTPTIVQVNGKSYMWYGASPTAASGSGFVIELATTNQILSQVVKVNDSSSLPIQLASDGFIRGAYPENPLVDANWATSLFNPMKILSAGIAEAASAAAVVCGVSYTGVTWPNDQYSEVTIGAGFKAGAGANFVVAACRISGTVGSPNAYAAFIRNDGVVFVEKYNTGTATNLSGPGFATTVTDGDVYRLTVVGTKVSLYQNGQFINSVTDATVTSGNAGFGADVAVTLSLAPISLWAGGSPGFSVQGNVGVAGATISWVGPTSGSTTSDASGNYNTNDMLTNGAYVITPSLVGYTFSPTSSNQTITSANITGVNFTATANSTGIKIGFTLSESLGFMYQLTNKI